MTGKPGDRELGKECCPAILMSARRARSRERTVGGIEGEEEGVRSRRHHVVLRPGGHVEPQDKGSVAIVADAGRGVDGISLLVPCSMPKSVGLVESEA